MEKGSLSNDYTAAIAYLYGRINYEQIPAFRPRKLNLENMRLLLDRLGNPHLKIPVVHVAGTKGKGSTSAMLASILTRAGYRTGLYTSPHLSCLEERFVVDGTRCTREELIELTEQIRPAVENVDREIHSAAPDLSLTFFEVTTAIAWLYFLRQKAEIVVLEVGMGGRLDSTNLCHPVVTVITSISFDHTKQLGNTLAAIASEKAGIIKPGVPVVSGVEQPEARAVIQQVASAAPAPLISLGDDFHVSRSKNSSESHHFLADNRLDFERLGKSPQTLHDVEVELLGNHQLRNAAVALATAGCLNEKGWRIDEAAIRTGLAQVQCTARIEVISRNPTIVVDTAHNLASIAALVETLNEQFPAKRRTAIFAASRDKDTRGMLQLLLPNFNELILTKFTTNPRGADADILAKTTQELLIEQEPQAGRSPKITVRHDPREAWNYCRDTLNPGDLVCVTGSFFLAAELRPVLLTKIVR